MPSFAICCGMWPRPPSAAAGGSSQLKNASCASGHRKHVDESTHGRRSQLAQICARRRAQRQPLCLETRKRRDGIAITLPTGSPGPAGGRRGSCRPSRTARRRSAANRIARSPSAQGTRSASLLLRSCDPSSFSPLGCRGVPFLASRGLRWGGPPASNGTKGVRGTPLHRKATQPAPGGGGGKCTRGRRKAPRWLGSSPSRRISEQC